MTPVERISAIVHRNREILILDYTDCHGQSYIDVFYQAKEWLLQEKRVVGIISVFNNKTFVSAEVMRVIEKEMPAVDQYIFQNTIVGISTTQQWILKGVNLWYTKQIHSFHSLDEAKEFLSKD